MVPRACRPSAPVCTKSADSVCVAPSAFCTSARVGAAEAGATGGGRDAFLDGLAALVAKEKDALRERLLESGGSGVDHEAGLREVLEEVRYELGEIRGRLESLETAVDGLKRRLEVDGAMQS